MGLERNTLKTRKDGTEHRRKKQNKRKKKKIITHTSKKKGKNWDEIVKPVSISARKQQANNENHAKTNKQRKKVSKTYLNPPFIGRENALLHTPMSLKTNQSSVGLTSDNEPTS